MSYIIALLPDDESQAQLAKRSRYLLDCMKQASEGVSEPFYLPLVEVDNDSQIATDEIIKSMDAVKAYACTLQTAGITCVDSTLRQRMVRDGSLHTLKRKVIRAGAKQGLMFHDINDFPYIACITHVEKPSDVRPRLWMNDQTRFSICGASLILMDQEAHIIYQRSLPLEPLQYVYILKCGDGSYYTGWTNHLEKRLLAHQSGLGAKYTKSHQPVELVYVETFTHKQDAMRQEYAYKQLSRKAKETLIHNYKTKKMTSY